MVGIERPSNFEMMSLGDNVAWATRRTPDKPAVVVPEKGKVVTFSEFNDRVNQAAHAFIQAGLEKGDRVGFLTDNSERMLVAEYGAFKAGLVASINNTQLDTDTISYQLDNADVDAIVIDDKYYSKVEPFLEESSVNAVVTIAWESDDTETETFESFITGAPTTEPHVDIDRQDPALIMYTSGTTSLPKGVLHTHESYNFNTATVTTKLNISLTDIVGQVLPLFHITESVQRSALLLSATSVVFRDFDPDTFLAAVDEHDITLFTLMSSMYRRLFTEGNPERWDYSSVRRCVYGMPMEMSVRERVVETFDARIQLIMGQTESGIPMYFDHEWQLEKPGNYVGQSGPFTDVAIMDDDGNLLPAGETGEIVFRGPSIMAGYINNEEKTREVWRHGWHHTEDMGKFDEDGLLLFVDRKKDMIKTGGENVSTSKVQNVVSDHPSVQESIIIGLPHDRWGEAVTAFVILVDDSDTTPEEIREHAKQHLATFEVPKAVEFVDDLPRTATDKLRKTDLVQEYQDYYR